MIVLIDLCFKKIYVQCKEGDNLFNQTKISVIVNNKQAMIYFVMIGIRKFIGFIVLIRHYALSSLFKYFGKL